MARRAAETFTGSDTCMYGCGELAAFRFTTNNRVCCSAAISSCPGQIEKRRAALSKPKTPLEAYSGGGMCDYGCDSVANFRQKDGRILCSSNYRKCPAYAKKRGDALYEKTGHRSLMHNPEFQAKIATSNLQRFGVESPFARPEVRAKASSTTLNRYGVSNPFASTAVQTKIRSTNLDKYGVENPSSNRAVRNRRRNTFLSKYGVSNPNQIPAAQGRSKKTNLARYGAEHPMQNSRVALRSLNSSLIGRDYRLPSGRVVHLAGYEPQVLEDLLRSGLRENDFDFDLKSLPDIWYINEEGIRSRYIPDFYIPRLNWIIEVKSPYTFSLEKAKNLAKFQGCRSLGYSMNFVVRSKRRALVLLEELRHQNEQFHNGCRS